MSRPPARLAIRADGDARLGFGHVMRCAVLARALLDAGQALVWFSRTPQALPASLAARIEIRPMRPDDEDAAILLPALVQADFAGLIADWQITDAQLCRQLRQGGVWLALIGNHLGGAEADLTIRQGFEPALKDDPANTCAGSAHILLADGYADLPQRTIKPHVKRLLISLGGSDTPVLGAVLDAVLQALDGLPSLHGVDLDIRRATPLAAGLPETGLLDALRAADLAILAAGTTLHEAAATGLAAIALPIAPNQLERAEQFARLGLGVSLDPAAAGFASALRQQVEALMGSSALRQQFSRAGQAALDGRGAGRVARQVTDHLAQALARRPESASILCGNAAPGCAKGI
jgi:UDP-2,4-diacetamido-2,4,6-trideoxy-beta-L-altropyranose hydrolase